MISTLDKLQNWFAKECNSDWEDSYGITIETVGNPGWWVEIDLQETALLNKELISINYNMNISSVDWFFCKKEDAKFKASGDPTKLKKILEIFLEWAEEKENHKI
jgi:hypothetical protein